MEQKSTSWCFRNVILSGQITPCSHSVLHISSASFICFCLCRRYNCVWINGFFIWSVCSCCFLISVNFISILEVCHNKEWTICPFCTVHIQSHDTDPYESAVLFWSYKNCREKAMKRFAVNCLICTIIIVSNLSCIVFLQYSIHILCDELAQYSFREAHIPNWWGFYIISHHFKQDTRFYVNKYKYEFWCLYRYVCVFKGCIHTVCVTKVSQKLSLLNQSLW